jgi:hypothetical protein
MDGQQVIFAKHPFGDTGLIGYNHQPKVGGKQAQCLGYTGQNIYTPGFAYIPNLFDDNSITV